MPALALGALAVTLALAAFGAAAAFGPAPLTAWSFTPLSVTLLAAAGVAWLLAVVGLVRAGMALFEATGTKGLALLALAGNAALAVAPLVAILKA